MSIVAQQAQSAGQLKARLPEVIRALVALTERELYTASAEADDVDRVVAIIDRIWQRTLRLTPG